MSSRFGSSTLHQRDARSALFDGYDRRSRSGTPGSTSSTPARGGGSALGPGNGNPYSSMGGGGYATPPSNNYSSAYPGNGAGGGGGVGLSNSDHNPYRTATPNRRGQYSDAVMDELESQNDREVEGMSAKVRMLRDLTSAIGDEIRDSSALADKMNDQFENARVRLRGTMNRMLAMARRTGIGWRVWLAFFAALTLLFWYVWLF